MNTVYKLGFSLLLTTVQLISTSVAAATLPLAEDDAKNTLAIANKFQKYIELSNLGLLDRQWTEIATTMVSSGGEVVTRNDYSVDYCNDGTSYGGFKLTVSDLNATLTAQHTGGAIDYMVTNDNYERIDGNTDATNPRTVHVTHEFDLMVNGYPKTLHAAFTAERKNWVCGSFYEEGHQTMVISENGTVLLTATRDLEKQPATDSDAMKQKPWNITTGDVQYSSPKGDLTTRYASIDYAGLVTVFGDSAASNTGGGSDSPDGTTNTGSSTDTTTENGGLAEALAGAMNPLFLLLVALPLLRRRD